MLIWVHILTLVQKLIRLSRHKNIFAKGYTQICTEEDFVIKKVRNIVPYTEVIAELNGKEIVATCYENTCKRQIKQSL